MQKIVVFTSGLPYAVCKGIVRIYVRIPHLALLIVVHSPPRTLFRLLRNQLMNLKRNGWRWIPYQTGEILRLLVRTSPTAPGKELPGHRFQLASLVGLPNVRVLTVQNIHAAATLDQIRQFAPQLGISLAAPILKSTAFRIPPLGTLNLHKGSLPHYRGMPPAFWELWNDAQSVGCSVHWVEEKLDTGDIVCESTVHRAPFSTLTGLQLCLDEVGVQLTATAVSDVLAGTAKSRPQGSGGRTNRKPTLAQFAQLATRVRRPGPNRRASSKQAAKSTLLFGLQCLSALGLQKLTTPRITVLLYHRVTDAVRDNLTVGIEQFDTQMALLRRSCHVLSIDEVLATSNIKASNKPLVAVTFDDGYQDNYEFAAPILERHAIPATFFVSTGIIENAGRFPHDLRRGNPAIPVMNWHQLRDMRDRGFTIGSHSVSHIDCAAVPEDLVIRELAQSRDDIRRELAYDNVIFAYPYGGRINMTAARLQLVRQAGYRGCLSAYGGSNLGSVDPFNVLRRGIHWEFSNKSFLLECYGMT